MNKDWVCILKTHSSFQIPIIQARLEEENIMSVCMDKHDSNYLFGESELHCHKNDVQEAISILTEMGYTTCYQAD